MTTIRRDQPPNLTTRDGTRPRSPAEALEPGRAPSRPRNSRLREPPKAVSGLVRFFSGLLTLSLLVLGGAGGSLLLLYHLYEKPGPLESNTVVVIPQGEGRTEIADRLEREGVIANRWAFMASYLGQRYFGSRPDLTLKAGEYELKAGASMREVMDVLASGRSVGYRVAVPEGLTSQQIVERLKADLSLTGDIAAVPSEGTLAPDTYSFNKGAERSGIIQRMQDAQVKILEEAWAKRQEGLPLASKEEALILASIVEKETGRNDERSRVAAVFVNRLRKGMPLQSDPTILYGIYGGAVQWGKPILQSEKEAKNAHNTYQIKGLPPSPICNPGAAAIEAVLNPASTKDLYFVADGNGGHKFSETLKEHNEAVALWRKIEKNIRAKEAEAKEEEATKSKPAAAPGPAGPAAPDRPVVVTVPAEPPAPGIVAIPNPSAADGDALPAAGSEASAAALPTSTVPLPVRKPKK